MPKMKTLKDPTAAPKRSRPSLAPREKRRASDTKKASAPKKSDEPQIPFKEKLIKVQNKLRMKYDKDGQLLEKDGEKKPEDIKDLIKVRTLDKPQNDGVKPSEGPSDKVVSQIKSSLRPIVKAKPVIPAQ
jgi:hypothetical protein